MKNRNITCVGRLKTIPAWQSSKRSGRWLGRWYTGMGRWDLASHCPRQGAGGTPRRSHGSSRGCCWRWTGFPISIRYRRISRHSAWHSAWVFAKAARRTGLGLVGGLRRGSILVETGKSGSFAIGYKKTLGELREFGVMRSPVRLLYLWQSRTDCCKARRKNRWLPAVPCGFPARQCPHRA